MKIKSILVDDEDLARQMIKEYLGSHPNIEVIAECSSGKQAVKKINELQPDLVFLDIQMPELSGFEVLQKLRTTPFIIFSTAYDQYALRAFEVNATDYLLKPYDRRRFGEAINRVLERMQNRENPAEKILSLLNTLQSDLVDAERLWIKDSGTVKPIKYEDIDWIEAMDDYVCLHVGKETHLIHQTMRDLEARLDQKHFMRIHRSTIVNLDRIKELRPLGDGSYKVILRDETSLVLSRSQAKRVKELIL
ncbi:LytTR family DNA-binding domain-containing protein [bacterium]|nr:LytTR family DNA-binding domain-containing protein [bacterium]